MASFIWHDSYNVGDPSIDGQHRRLFDLANGLLFAGDQADLNDAMAHLRDYVRVHFKAEEHLMRRVAYPGLQPHMRLHRGLVERLDGLAAKIAAGASPHEDLRVFMHQWLVGHIVEHDRRLAEFTGALAPRQDG